MPNLQLLWTPGCSTQCYPTWLHFMVSFPFNFTPSYVLSMFLNTINKTYIYWLHIRLRPKKKKITEKTQTQAQKWIMYLAKSDKKCPCHQCLSQSQFRQLTDVRNWHKSFWSFSFHFETSRDIKKTLKMSSVHLQSSVDSQRRGVAQKLALPCPI